MSATEAIGLDEGLSSIKQIVNKLEGALNGNLATAPFSKEEYMAGYTKAYDMCTQRAPYNWSEQLYAYHSEAISNYLGQKVLPAIKGKSGIYLLEELVIRWERHELMTKWMKKFFMYLDRYHVTHQSLPTLKEAGQNAFKAGIFDIVKEDVCTAMLKLIEANRDGEDVDDDLLRRCVQVYQAMESRNLVYETDFEVNLLRETEAYYQKKAATWLETDSTPAYLIKAEAVLEAEKQRVALYLLPSTEAKLIEVCQDKLLRKLEVQLLEKEGSGMRVLLRDEKKEDLSRMFRLFLKIENGLNLMAQILKEHVVKMGEEIVNKREATIAAEAEKESPSDPAFVQSLLALNDLYKTVIAEQFDGHPLFQKALKEAFEQFVNTNVGKYSNAEMLSTYCDRLLKTGGEKLSDAQIEENLEKIVQLFSYLQDKDLFSEIYRNALAKRLLSGKSSSDDAERSMIAKLKLRCGAQFTSKMEGMITDLSMGSDSRAGFANYVAMENQKSGGSTNAMEDDSSSSSSLIQGIDFTVDVLTTGHWPSYKMVDLVLPEQMSACVNMFVNYYNKSHDHRTLKWVHSLGDTVLKSIFKKTYDLQVTTLQAVTLLYFNGNEDYVSFEELKQKLNIEEDVLKRVMHSLSMGKMRVLIKEPNAKTMAPTDKFKVNSAFASPLRKLRIPMASLDESHNPKRVEEDRSIAIEASIVRIMKSRKVLGHAQLVAEVLTQLQTFKPNPKVVKKRIEHLIDREYLERDETQANVYKYLA